MNSMLLKDRVCVVTGAASGIGRQIALTFAQEGGRVCIVDIQKEKAEAAAAEAGGQAYACNLRSVEEIKATVAAIRADFGRIDVLVNVAGLANRTPIVDITEAEWDLLNDVNLKATFFMSREVYKIMLGQEGGKIINMSSQRSRASDDHHTIYDATKAGVEAITRSFANAGGPHNITANSILPGYVLTPMTRHNLDDENWVRHLYSRVPMQRLIEMQEIANAALFLASDLSNGMSGQDITMDGGRLAHE